jgi:hypothetical protein
MVVRTVAGLQQIVAIIDSHFPRICRRREHD